jgi:two-component system response regulator RegA
LLLSPAGTMHEREGAGAQDMAQVLLIEDDPVTVCRLNHVLASRGVLAIAHAATIAEALGLLDPPPDWIILDLNLPDGTGLIVLEAIRKAKLSIRVVVSSATKDAATIAAVASYRPELILPKPLDLALLPIGRD